MYRYYITSVVIFLVFSLICGMALAEDHSEKLSVVAVGDNLIHPVVIMMHNILMVHLILSQCILT